MSECYLSHVALGLRYRLLQFIIPEALIRYTVRLLFMKPDVLFRFSVRLIFSTPDDLNMQIECCLTHLVFLSDCYIVPVGGL